MAKEQKDWDAVVKALILIEKSMADEDFQRWLGTNKDALEFDYDQYAQSCYEGYEMPENFNYWAFGRFLGEVADK